MAILSLRPAVVTLLVLVLTGTALGAPAAPSVNEVKAAFLCSFAEFVEWPAAANQGPVTIAILGKDPFGPLLEETAKVRALQTKALEIHRLTRVEDAARFRIVFVSASEARSLGQILRSLEGTSVLTVSDIPGFAAQGGIIGFVPEGKRVRFEINVAAAERSRVQISSRLLNLARLVHGAPKSGT